MYFRKMYDFWKSEDINFYVGVVGWKRSVVGGVGRCWVVEAWSEVGKMGFFGSGGGRW